MHTRLFILIFACLLGIASGQQSRGDVVIALGPPVVAGTTASLDVFFQFTGDPGDTIDAFQLSVIGSDAALTSGGANFGRFSFAANPALFGAWSGSPSSIGDFGFSLFTPNDLIGGPFLLPAVDPYRIGTLNVNLAGLVAEFVTVTLAGNDPLFPTWVGGNIGGVPAEIPIDFAQPGGVAIPIAAAAVPEGGTFALAAVGMALLAGYRQRRSQGMAR